MCENILITVGKTDKKIYNLGCRVAILADFHKITRNEMCVSINKQLINFKNFLGVLFRLCQGKVRRRFLITDVSADKTTLCSGQHVAHEQRVEGT